MTTIGILLFDRVEELDAVGPWEVFTSARRDGDIVLTVSQDAGTVRGAKGLGMVADHSFEDCPPLDVVVVPGGQGTRTEVGNPVLLAWLAGVSARATWVTSVCTGALLHWGTGVALGRSVTTHWAFVEELRARGGLTVLDDQRWVVDGNLVTSAGVSAGIDMSLWLVGQLYGVDHARDVQRWIEYSPAPPYASEAGARPM